MTWGLRRIAVGAVGAGAGSAGFSAVAAVSVAAVIAFTAAVASAAARPSPASSSRGEPPTRPPVSTQLPAQSPSPVPSEPPRIASLLKPEVHKRVVSEREIMTHATLDKVPESSKPAGYEDLRRYSFYAAMLVRASLAQTRRILTDYQVYSKLIPYIDRTAFDPETRMLDLEGGVWKYRLASRVRFEEIGERWIRYRIVSGSFAGLAGDILFEPEGEKGTAVFFRGESIGRHWPPAFIIERGAELVFSFTARKMRSHIESQKTAPPPSDAPRNGPAAGPKDGKNDSEIPQPRRSL